MYADQQLKVSNIYEHTCIHTRKEIPNTEAYTFTRCLFIDLYFFAPQNMYIY